VKTILDCELPNPADDIIFCTRTWHSDSSSSTSDISEVVLGVHSNCDSEAESSHDKKRATVSIAEDLDIVFLEVPPDISGSLQLLSSEGASRTEVGLG